MRCGIFNGKLKAAKKDLLSLANEHHLESRKFLDTLGRLRREVESELSNAANTN